MHIHTSHQEKLKLGIGSYTCNWGTHICGLYETESERDEIIYGFLKQGYNDGDLQMYCPEEQSQQEFKQGFSSFCPECAAKLNDKNHFEISSAKELYYPDGSFDPWYMDKSLGDFYAESQKNGKRNIRATAEMVWALDKVPGIEYLMAYEARLNYFIPGKPWISICMYNVNKFDGATIMNVLRTHPFTIGGGIITSNPYYAHPDEWLMKNAPQFLGQKK